MKCIQTSFDGHGLSGFGDLTPFCLPSKTAKISWTIVHGGQKNEKIELAQKIYTSRS